MNEMFRSFCCLSNIAERLMRQKTEGKKEREALVDRWKGKSKQIYAR